MSLWKSCWLFVAWGEVRSRLVKAPSLRFAGSLLEDGAAVVVRVDKALPCNLDMTVQQARLRRILTSPRFSFASGFLLAPAFAVLRIRAHRSCPDIGPEPDCRFHKVSFRWMATGRETLLEPHSLHCVVCDISIVSRVLPLLVFDKGPSHIPILASLLTMPSSKYIAFVVLILLLDRSSARLDPSSIRKRDQYHEHHAACINNSLHLR